MSTTIATLESKAGFTGPDLSLEISLFEYGMGWKELSETNELEVIYAVKYSESKEQHNLFDRCTFKLDLDIKKEFNWVKWDEFFQNLGLEDYYQEDWLDDNHSLGNKLYDLFCVYGYENVFGTCYTGGFTISED